MFNKIALIGAGSLILSSTAFAHNSVEFADPVDGVGIGYEWTVTASENGTIEYVGAVGAKSSWEPEFEDPNRGWTHTSDWTALTLEAKKMVTIELHRQQGVTFSSTDSETGEVSVVTAGNCLVPAFSVYSGIDSSSESEPGSFNSAGDFWSTISFAQVTFDLNPDTTSVKSSVILDAGEYTLNFGGANGAIFSSEDAACFNGQHGFRAKIMISDAPMTLMGN